jgi:hypothetical protein
VLLALAWTVMRLLLARRRVGGLDPEAFVTAWQQRVRPGGVTDLAQVRAMVQDTVLSLGLAGTTGESKEARLANLAALHADGRITAERLTALRAEIDAEP